MDSWEFYDPLLPNVNQRNTHPRTQEEIDETTEALKRLNHDLEEGEASRTELLSEIGLDLEDQKKNWWETNSSKIVSVVPKDHPWFLPRPELWETVEIPDASETLDRMGDWPARLLHVPTMTSLQWYPDNWYGASREPQYAIISYSWGRWRISPGQGPALKVFGVDWEIPPVDPELFSVSDFERVIKKVSREALTEHVWVDIACIDQNPGSLQGAREIGRQTKIFRMAQKAFIWLLDKEQEKDGLRIEQALQNIESASALFDSAHRQWFLEYALPRSTNEVPANQTFHEMMPRSNDGTLMSGSNAISTLTRMPWFTSLWTLQEAFLRPDAKFVDRAGHISCSIKGLPYELGDILAYCKQLHQLLSSTPNRLAGGEDRQIDFISEQATARIIGRSGLQALADRDRTSIYACANMRQATNPEDRIYGIMQIWNLHLGKASPNTDPTHTWTPYQLELQLGKALVQLHPLESQIHVHMQSVHDRQGWRIGKHSDVPLHTLTLNESGSLQGAVNRHGSVLGVRRANRVTYGYFHGKICPFNSLLGAWSYHSRFNILGQESAYQPSPVRISLDGNVALNSTTLQARYSLQNVPEDKQIQLAEQIAYLSQTWDRQLYVLLLGTVTQESHGVERTTSIGVIVMDAPDETIGLWRKRLGICLWEVHYAASSTSSQHQDMVQVLAGISSGWETSDCLFG